MLLTTSVASASPSTSSAMIRSGLPDFATCSSSGRRSRMLLIFLSCSRMYGSSSSDDLLVRIVDEVGRDVAAIELHAFDEIELVLEALAVFDGDHAFLADLVHRFGDRLADCVVCIRRDRTDLSDFLAGRARLADLLELGDDGIDRLVDAALQIHRVHARGDILEAFAADRLREHRGRRRAVAGDVGGLGRDFLHHLRAHVLELVLQLDFLRDRHAVLGDRRGAEAALEHDIAALGAQRNLDRVGQDVHADHHVVAYAFAEADVFGCHIESPECLKRGDGRISRRCR